MEVLNPNEAFVEEKKQENPNMVYGRLVESVHISGYSLERAIKEFEYLLDDNRWQLVGKGYNDINEFVRSLSFAEFKIAVEQRKKIANKLKQLEASQRATAEMLGVGVATVNRDTVPSGTDNKEKVAKYQEDTIQGVPYETPEPEPEYRTKENTELFSKSGRDLLSIAEQKDKKAHVSNNSGENEWYTPAKYIEAARLVMGDISLDPASSLLANETVKAEMIYTKDDDGLQKEWYGNVWMNPPYAQPLIQQFSDKLISELPNINQACVLVNNATDTEWLYQMLKNCQSVCFIKGRVKFIDKNGDPSGAPLQGQVILYFGSNIFGFINEFKQFGVCLNVAK